MVCAAYERTLKLSNDGTPSCAERYTRLAVLGGLQAFLMLGNHVRTGFRALALELGCRERRGEVRSLRLRDEFDKICHPNYMVYL